MSILDYTTGLFREPANLRAFVDDPQQALRAAGLPDATADQVHELMPLVAESMPPDHPLQAVVHADDPVAALKALDIDDLIADLHDHHRDVQQIEKALGGPETISAHAQATRCAPDTEDSPSVVEPVGTWESTDEGDKVLGAVVDDPLTPEIEGPPEDYPEAADEQMARELVEPDFSAVVWGKTLE